MDKAFYFETFLICKNGNGTYKFTAKSDVRITDPTQRTTVVGPINGKKVVFNVTNPNKGQDFVCDNIDFTSYDSYDLINLNLSENGRPSDYKSGFVIKKNTKYPPPDGEQFFDLLKKRIKTDQALLTTDPNQRFELTRLYGVRVSDKVYGLEFKILDSEAPEYVAADYRAIYDDYNFIVAIVLFIERPSDTDAHPPESEINFKLSNGDYKNFKPAALTPIIVVEKKDDNYLDVDWENEHYIIASIRFD